MRSFRFSIARNSDMTISVMVRNWMPYPVGKDHGRAGEAGHGKSGMAWPGVLRYGRRGLARNARSRKVGHRLVKATQGKAVFGPPFLLPTLK